MARFVLVHGAFCGAWIWEPLMSRLKTAGHSVEALDMPALGDDPSPVGENTLEGCAQRVCKVLGGSREPAILVGHSMGGMVVSQAAARCPRHVAALVYVAAFLPKDGQSLIYLTKLPEGADDEVQANIRIEGNPAVAVMPSEASGDALYGCCPEEVTAWATGKHRPQPVAPFVAPVSIPPGALDGIRRYYVLCKRDRAIPPALQRRMIAETPCDEVVELDTDHTPQLSKTSELAAALQQFAAHVAVATSA